MSLNYFFNNGVAFFYFKKLTSSFSTEKIVSSKYCWQSSMLFIKNLT